MKLLNQDHCPYTRARHHRRNAHLMLLLSISALLGACSLDTAPDSTPSRAALETDRETEMEMEAEAESSTLDTPTEMMDPRSAAGAAAPAPAPTQSAQTSAAIVPPPKAAPAPEQEPENKAAAAPKAPEPQQAVDTSGCKPGDYEGVIAGTVNLGPLEVSTLTGKINLRLVADEHNDKLLRVKQGRVEGIDLNRAVFIADITGAVDCSTGELMQSEVERGMYEDTNEVIKIGFTGVAEGRYSADPPALLGTWNISDDSTLLAGQGTWTTTLAESLR